MPKEMSKRDKLREQVDQASWVVNRLRAEADPERVKARLDAKQKQIDALQDDVFKLRLLHAEAPQKLEAAVAHKRELEQELALLDQQPRVDTLKRLLAEAREAGLI